MHIISNTGTEINFCDEAGTSCVLSKTEDNTELEGIKLGPRCVMLLREYVDGEDLVCGSLPVLSKAKVYRKDVFGRIYDR
jgi:hypothetical protein